MSTAVKLFHSGMTGAPTLNGTAGALLGVLQACLVDGWGVATVDSLTVSSGIATVTIGAGHPFEVDSVSLISGATVSGGTVNGEQRVLSVTATTYTFATTVGDQTATGTIQHKVAPLGWERQWSDTNKAAYRATDIESTQMVLRVDDTAALEARVVGYESMSGIDTGTNPFPTAAQVSGGAYITKANSTTPTNARAWVLAGDSAGFYLNIVAHNSSDTLWRITHYFGDILSVKSPDAYRCILAAPDSGYSGTTTPSADDIPYSSRDSAAAAWMARAHTGTVGAVVVQRVAGGISTQGASGYSGRSLANNIPYPNGPDDGLYLAPMFLLSNAGLGIRGTFPGFSYCHNGIDFTFAHLERVTDVTGLAGRRLCAWRTGTGAFFIDISGPWR